MKLNVDPRPLKQSLVEIEQSMQQMQRSLALQLGSIDDMVERIFHGRRGGARGISQIMKRLASALEGYVFDQMAQALERTIPSTLGKVGAKSSALSMLTSAATVFSQTPMDAAKVLGGGTGGISPINLAMTVVTPDAHSFRSSQGQVLAELASAMTRARRYL